MADVASRAVIRVPGKVIIAGEHAVVNGHSALAASVNLYLTVTISPSNQFTISSETTGESETLSEPQLLSHLTSPEPTASPSPASTLLLAVHLLLAHLPPPPTVAATLSRVSIAVASDIPPMSGLGSSAALSVGLTRAVCRVFSLSIPSDELYTAAKALEDSFHGTSSGLDVFTVLHPGVFVTSSRGRHSTLPQPDPTHPRGRVLVVHTGVTRRTGDAVGRVQAGDTDLALDAIGRLSAMAGEAARRGDLGTCFDVAGQTQPHLDTIGVTGEPAAVIISETRKIGWVGKISGAGMGGVVIFPYVEGRDTTGLVKALAGGRIWDLELPASHTLPDRLLGRQCVTCSTPRDAGLR